MNFRLLGWVSVVLAVIASSPYWLRKLNSWTFKTKDKRFFRLLKFLRPVHKIAGIALAVISLYHGYLALGGRLRLHTGLLVYLSFLLTAILGALHYFKKNKHVFKSHKIVALISFAFFLLHLISPWALYSWFGI